jgi:hypothetical protein
MYTNPDTTLSNRFPKPNIRAIPVSEGTQIPFLYARNRAPIKEIEDVTYGKSSSKKDAKKKTAFEMLQSVLEK